MDYEMDPLSTSLLRARERDMSSILGRELYQPQQYVPPQFFPHVTVPDVPTALALSHPLLGLEAFKEKNLTDVTVAALMAKPPKANIVRVSERTTWAGNQEITVRYDRYSTGEKVVIGAAVIAGVTIAAGLVALVAGAYVAGKAIEAAGKSKDD